MQAGLMEPPQATDHRTILGSAARRKGPVVSVPITGRR